MDEIRQKQELNPTMDILEDKLKRKKEGVLSIKDLNKSLNALRKTNFNADRIRGEKAKERKKKEMIAQIMFNKTVDEYVDNDESFNNNLIKNLFKTYEYPYNLKNVDKVQEYAKAVIKSQGDTTNIQLKLTNYMEDNEDLFKSTKFKKLNFPDLQKHRKTINNPKGITNRQYNVLTNVKIVLRDIFTDDDVKKVTEDISQGESLKGSLKRNLTATQFKEISHLFPTAVMRGKKRGRKPPVVLDFGPQKPVLGS